LPTRFRTLVNTELIDEVSEAIKTGNQNEALELILSLWENEQKINYHGKRVDAIVEGMLHHSRSSTGVEEPKLYNRIGR
jgi:two-component system, NtrC family, sensor kinase